MSASGVLVSTKAAPAPPVAVTLYIPFCTALAWSLISNLSSATTAAPSTDNAPLASAVKVPAPLSYRIPDNFDALNLLSPDIN